MSLSPIKTEKVSAVPLWQRWLSPHELVRDKERAGEIQILDTQLFAEEISNIYLGKQKKSEQRAALQQYCAFPKAKYRWLYPHRLP